MAVGMNLSYSQKQQAGITGAQGGTTARRVRGGTLVTTVIPGNTPWNAKVTRRFIPDKAAKGEDIEKQAKKKGAEIAEKTKKSKAKMPSLPQMYAAKKGASVTKGMKEYGYEPRGAGGSKVSEVSRRDKELKRGGIRTMLGR
jgi:hypothetical protein